MTRRETSLALKDTDDFIEMSSPDKLLWVRIKKSALNDAILECSKSNDLETGGALAGYYSKNKSTCTIDSFLKPTSDSAHHRYNFESGVFGLKEIFSKLWPKKRFYVGDWHFHPKSSPQPSAQDLKQLKDISEAENMKCKAPLMVIIGEIPEPYSLSVTVHFSDEGPISFS